MLDQLTGQMISTARVMSSYEFAYSPGQFAYSGQDRTRLQEYAQWSSEPLLGSACPAFEGQSRRRSLPKAS
jgi:hypothetical protein